MRLYDISDALTHHDEVTNNLSGKELCMNIALFILLSKNIIFSFSFILQMLSHLNIKGRRPKAFNGTKRSELKSEV